MPPHPFLNFYNYYGFKRNPDAQIQQVIRNIHIDPADDLLWERLYRLAQRAGLVIELSDGYLRSMGGGMYVMNVGRHFDSGALALEVFEQTRETSNDPFYLPILELEDELREPPIEIRVIHPREIPS